MSLHTCVNAEGLTGRSASVIFPFDDASLRTKVKGAVAIGAQRHLPIIAHRGSVTVRGKSVLFYFIHL